MQERPQIPEPADERPAAYAQWDAAAPRRRLTRGRVELLILLGAAIAIAVVVLIARRPIQTAGITVQATVTSPAQMLADLDGDTNPVAQYDAALALLAPKCTQDEAGIAALGNAGYQDLVKNGITDETRLSVLEHLNGSIPASLGKTDCASMLSAYLLLREG